MSVLGVGALKKSHRPVQNSHIKTGPHMSGSPQNKSCSGDRARAFGLSKSAEIMPVALGNFSGLLVVYKKFDQQQIPSEYVDTLA